MTTGGPYDLVVVGGGPGGYVAAIRAAQLGLRTACVERERLGGICGTWGCIPTKALLRSAEVLALCRRAAEFGVTIEGKIGFDYAAIMARARKVARAGEKGIAFLFEKHGVDRVAGTARLAGPGKVVVSAGDGRGETTLAARRVLVATGARARSLPGIEIDGTQILDYRGALSLAALPRSIVIVGAGAIGVELASFWRELGVEVTLVEYLPRIVPLEDEEVSDALARAFRKRGIALLPGTRVTGARREPGAVTLAVEDRADPARRRELRAEMALVAVGVAANVEGIGLEAAGVKVERGFVVVDDTTYETTAKGVFAVGDVTGPPALAHTASAEAVACVERMAGLAPPPLDYDAVPYCTFSHPEIGSVGLSEARARALGRPIKVGRFPYRALGKARAAGETEGFVKVIWDAADGRLVGAHIVGAGASDLIAEYTLARTTEVNAPSLMHTIHAHPTLAEALREATEDAYGRAINV